MKHCSWWSHRQLEQLEKPSHVPQMAKPVVEDYIKNHDNISAILLDWNMPICNASAPTLFIRDHEKMQLPPIPIVIMTAPRPRQTNELGLPPNIHVLHKPVTINDLSQLFTTLPK